MMRVTCPLMCGDSECEEAFPKGFETQSEGWGGAGSPMHTRLVRGAGGFCFASPLILAPLAIAFLLFFPAPCFTPPPLPSPLTVPLLLPPWYAGYFGWSSSLSPPPSSSGHVPEAAAPTALRRHLTSSGPLGCGSRWAGCEEGACRRASGGSAGGRVS